jgi:NitT/TauT family transport system permease protein
MRLTKDRWSDLALGAAGIGVFLGFWQLAGTLGWGGLTLPALSDVLATLVAPQRQAIFARAVTATLYALARGYAIGAVLGIGLAATTRLLPTLQQGLDTFAALLHAIPAIALAPIFMLFFLPEEVPVAIAAISVFFILYVATRSALAAATHAHQDVFTALGASRWKRYAYLELPAALPQIASALKLAVPAGLVGIVVGEWFGAPRGLGLLMVSAMQNFQIPQLWGAVLLASFSSIILYGVFSIFERAAHQRYR